MYYALQFSYEPNYLWFHFVAEQVGWGSSASDFYSRGSWFKLRQDTDSPYYGFLCILCLSRQMSG
jgi:hypothetical protein